MVISNLVNPSFVSSLSAIVFGVTMGINEVIYSFNSLGLKHAEGGFGNG